MNEYQVTLTEPTGERTVTLQAATAAAAREDAEDRYDADVLAVRFVRALTFSCRTRGQVT